MTSEQIHQQQAQQQQQQQTPSQQQLEFAQTVRKFESSYVRVPFEQFRRAFRQEMRLVEKDLPALEGLCKKHISGKSEVPENVIKALKERIRGLAEKAKEYENDSKKYRERFLKRMEWVERTVSEGTYRSWSRARLLRLIGDFLIRSGEIESAQEMCAKKPEMVDELDLELEEMRESVLKGFEGRDLSVALQWCADHRNNLKRSGSDLEFKLRRQEFIEQLRMNGGGDLSGAVKVAQKHFPTWLESNYEQIREALALLCWLPFLQKGIVWGNGLMGKYEDLMDEALQWSSLKEQFMKDFVEVYQVDQGSQLIKTVRTGLSVLKTRQCTQISEEFFNNNQSNSSNNNNNNNNNSSCLQECPACTGPLKSLALNHLPFGHFEMTKIRCRITGKLVSVDDPPMALPNGQVYSESGLRELSEESGSEIIKCPVTGQSFHLSEARKCFFL